MFPLLEMIGKLPHKSDYILPLCVTLGSTVTQSTRSVLLFYSRSVSVVFYIVDFTPFLFMCRWSIVILIDLSRCFLIKPSVRPGHVLRNLCCMALRILIFVGINSAAL